MLLVEGTPQSHVDLRDPTHLEFEYVRRMGHVLDLAAEPGAPLDVVHLGGGALTLPRYVSVTRPGSRQRVVEIDQQLTDLVREHLPLPRGARIRVRADDARVGLAALRDGSTDVVVTDVFAGARTPAHLTSTEFAAEAHRALRPGGIYVGERRRWPAAAVRPRPGRHAARRLPRRLPARRARHAARTPLRQPRRRRLRRRTPDRRPRPALRPRPDAGPRRPRRRPAPVRGHQPARRTTPTPSTPPNRPTASSAAEGRLERGERARRRTARTAPPARAGPFAARTPATACRAASSIGHP